MTPHELLVTCGVLVAAACWLAGNLAPWWRIVEWAHRDYLDDIYDEGYDDGRKAWLDRSVASGPAHDRGGVPVDAGADLRRSDERPHDVPRELPVRLEPLTGDWRADYAEQLAPAVLDAENLPGPDSTPAPRAGEHHEEFPLPAILHLGAEYDGGDQTFARVQLRQMTAINRHEAARKALLDECGVPFVPMEMCAA